MSYNNSLETAQKYLKRITTILNIDTRENHVIEMLIEEIRTVNNPFEFYDFIKLNQNTLGTNYKTGYQKFSFLLDKFKKSQISLEDSERDVLLNYVDKLFSKVTYVFDELSWRVQSSSFDINSDHVTRFIYENFNKKDLQVLRQIGNRKKILQRNRQKEVLRSEIEQIVLDFSLSKKKLALGYSSKNELVNPQIKALIRK